jgi:hypothetical protein
MIYNNFGSVDLSIKIFTFKKGDMVNEYKKSESAGTGA